MFADDLTNDKDFVSGDFLSWRRCPQWCCWVEGSRTMRTNKDLSLHQVCSNSHNSAITVPSAYRECTESISRVSIRCVHCPVQVLGSMIYFTSLSCCSCSIYIFSSHCKVYGLLTAHRRPSRRIEIFWNISHICPHISITKSDWPTLIWRTMYTYHNFRQNALSTVDKR